MIKRRQTLVLTVLRWTTTLAIIGSHTALAEEVSVAVASNALQAVNEIKKQFEKTTGNRVLVSSGSTGKLYTQIVNGAPYDIFMAANSREPERLEKGNAIIPGTRMTYAKGRLVLWRHASANATANPESLRNYLDSANFNRLTLANPKTAPYGYAAQEFLIHEKIWNQIQSKLIRAENVTQAFQYIQSQNADLGFVAYSQIKAYTKPADGSSYWLVPENLYTPINQQAVLLKHAQGNLAAREFMNYLSSPKIVKLLKDNYGYGV